MGEGEGSPPLPLDKTGSFFGAHPLLHRALSPLAARPSRSPRRAGPRGTQRRHRSPTGGARALRARAIGAGAVGNDAEPRRKKGEREKRTSRKRPSPRWRPLRASSAPADAVLAGRRGRTHRDSPVTDAASIARTATNARNARANIFLGWWVWARLWVGGCVLFSLCVLLGCNGLCVCVWMRSVWQGALSRLSRSGGRIPSCSPDPHLSFCLSHPRLLASLSPRRAPPSARRHLWKLRPLRLSPLGRAKRPEMEAQGFTGAAQKK